MQIDFSDIVAFGGLCATAITVLTFSVRHSDRITRAASDAQNALHEAAEASRECKELHERCTYLQAQVSAAREQAIEKFVQRQSLDDLEERLGEGLEKTEKRVTEAIDKLGSRLDQFLVGPHSR